MSRYIDAERFKLWVQENYVLYDGDRYFKDIDAQPTVDVRENIHAHWILDDPKRLFGHCSNCGCCGVAYDRFLFCPNCGAQMDERREDE